jgi:NDP-sugar pyrophosphorylase family protein
MNALLLSAGCGERLKPLTDKLPKCLLPMPPKGNLLHYWIETLVNAGIEKIYINIFWKQDEIVAYVDSMGKEVRGRIEFYFENRLEPVGEVLCNLKHWLGFQFLVVNTDTYIEKDRIVEFIHKTSISSEFPFCLGVSRQENAFGKSLISVRENDVIDSFVEKPQEGKEGFSYAGIMKMGSIVIDKEMSERELTSEIIPEYVGRIRCFDVGRIIDIGGSIEEYNRAREVLGG